MSLDINSLVESVKKASTDAVESSKPCAICFGKVLSISPLQVAIDQKLILGKNQLLLTSLVSKIDVDVKGANLSEKLSLDLSLKVSEELVMLRADGGQKYIVLDRLRGA